MNPGLDGVDSMALPADSMPAWSNDDE